MITTPVTVVMTTYVPEDVPERAEYLDRSIASLIKWLRPYDAWKIHVADDGSHNQNAVLDVINKWNKVVSYTITEHAGIGSSLNAALRLIPDNGLWLYTTDDWVLLQHYDIRPAIKLIEEAGYDYVRIGHPHPDVLCKIKFQQGCGYWLHLYADEGGFAFATRPFIATKRFYNEVGPFKEQCSSYDVEIDYAERMKHTQHGLAQINLRGDEWHHIGEKEVGYRYP